jgi:hypothetical protein
MSLKTLAGRKKLLASIFLSLSLRQREQKLKGEKNAKEIF